MRRTALIHRDLRPLVQLGFGWALLVVLASALVVSFSPRETADPGAPRLEAPPVIQPDTRSRPIATVNADGTVTTTEDSAPREEPRS